MYLVLYSILEVLFSESIEKDFSFDLDTEKMKEHSSPSLKMTSWIICCSVSNSCLTLCDPMDCSTPVFPVLCYLLEFVQIYLH